MGPEQSPASAVEGDQTVGLDAVVAAMSLG